MIMEATSAAKSSSFFSMPSPVAKRVKAFTVILPPSSLAMLVNLAVEGIDADKVVTLGKDVAMQICAMNPTYLDKSNVSQEILDKVNDYAHAVVGGDGEGYALGGHLAGLLGLGGQALLAQDQAPAAEPEAPAAAE